MAKKKDIISIDQFSLTPEELKILEERSVMADTMKMLNLKEKKLSQQVKDIFNKYKIEDTVEVFGKKFTVSDSVRKTVSDKDGFVSELINLNKKYLLSQSIEIDIDTLYEEYENGTIDKNIVEQYMKITPMQKLTVS